MGADDGRGVAVPHGDDGCPGMWHLVRAVLDLETGATTTYECELCGHYLRVEPGATHPTTV